MQIRRKILIVLCIYLSQIFFTPVIHFVGERSARDCGDCYASIQLNASCNNTNGPCNNPAHHHHNHHRHDPAQCTFCKSFTKDIEYVPTYYNIILDHLTLVHNITQHHAATFLRGMFHVRAPPLKDFLT
jgi:hypothetical protein